MQKIVLLVFLSLAAPSITVAQTMPQSPAWIEESKTDAFSNVSFMQFSLQGKFLSAPQDGRLTSPVMILKCVPSHHGLGFHIWKNGDLISASISFGSVVNSQGTVIPALYRLDDGKVHSTSLSPATNGTGAFLHDYDVNDFFFGHTGAHKENSSPQIAKVVISVDQFEAGKIVAEFDLPKSSDVPDKCGLIYHRP